MYKEISKQLDAMGYSYDQDELSKCIIRAHQKTVIQAMLVEAKKRNLDVYSDQTKTILAAISAEKNITVDCAVNTLVDYINSDLNGRKIYRDKLFSAALRISEEFHMVIIQNGEGINRVA
ncbi:hypothetical protein [Photobacterium sanguinicancri]|uniref:hypothetical protein n=1 Tax=Photobacterium sanguinicancri TaxID=875932 RepID=UPI0021C382A9|nr:hypothetical protein [Photobacterium sanguinicancri]